jgi:hypothetical protein
MRFEARQIVCESLSLKNLKQKRARGVAQVVSPEFKPQHHTHNPLHQRKQNNYGAGAWLEW